MNLDIEVLILELYTYSLSISFRFWKCMFFGTLQDILIRV